MAAEGLTDKEIARELNLSRRTIGTYWERLRVKVGPFSRTQLVARFLRLEAIDESPLATFHSLFSHWEEGVWIVRPDGTTIFANENFGTLLRGYSAADEDLLAQFERVTATSILQIIESSQSGSVTRELAVPRKAGGTVWLRLKVAPLRDGRDRISAVLLVLGDVSENRTAAFGLEHSTKSLSFIFWHASDPIGRFNRDLTCVSANPALVAYLGWQERSVVGIPLTEFGPLFEPIAHWSENFDHAFRTGDTHSFSTPSGQTFLLPEPSAESSLSTVLAIIRPEKVAT